MLVCSLCSIAFIMCMIQYNGRSHIAFSSTQQNKAIPQTTNTSARLIDPNLKLEVYASGLSGPTNIAFLDSGEMLVLEKNTGMVKKIINGTIQKEPLIDENVATFDTRGMLGIAAAKNITTNKENVFLYFTEAATGKGDGQDKCFEPPRCDLNNLPNGNRLYKYELSTNGSKLINKKLIFSWPPFTGATHNGGEMIVGPDKNIYLIVGDGEKKTVMFNGKDPIIDGRAGILAFDQSGNPAYKDGIIGSGDPLNRYYAYGIRNGFGLDFDPITGKLWDTENGPGFGDELNLVGPGFNSGHNAVDGFWERINYTEGKYVKEPDPNKLETFGGKGKYSPPEFAWYKTVGVSALKFLNTHKYGQKYKDNLLVATIVPNGDIYNFGLNKDRTSLNLPGLLKDKIVNNYTELAPVMFGTNFGGISDLSIGPDGYLYIASFGEGTIYRVVPNDSNANN